MVKTKVLSLLFALFFSFFYYPINAIAGIYQSTGNGNYHQASTWALIAGTGPAIPGNTDEVRILNGHVISATSSINIDILSVQTGGNLTLQTNGGLLQANSITVQSGGVIQGFDNLEVKIWDSEGWLSGNSYSYNGPLAAGESINYQAIINVPPDMEYGSKTKLYVVIFVNGEATPIEASIFTLTRR